MVHFYVATVTQLQRGLPLEDALLFDAVCLDPGAMKQANSFKMIEWLAKMISQVVSEISGSGQG